MPDSIASTAACLLFDEEEEEGIPVVGIERTSVVSAIVTPETISWAMARPIGTAVTSALSSPCW